eukprot:scaffold207627_cov14-Tisochrysis_lutea.AAC.2
MMCCCHTVLKLRRKGIGPGVRTGVPVLVWAASGGGGGAGGAGAVPNAAVQLLDGAVWKGW